MSNHIENGQVRVLGIDLGKSVFQLHGVDARGKSVLKQRLKRDKLLEFMAQLPPCLVGMEASSGAHHWARKFQGYGHDVRLMAPQYVKPYVKRHKNDSVDAEAICEAVQRPNMRFMGIKSVAQQEILALHRVRSLAVKNRTALVNQIRGLLAEYGIVFPKSIKQARRAIVLILSDESSEMSANFRVILEDERDELAHLDERIGKYEREIEALAKAEPQCRLLMTIPGVGPITATALLASVGDVRAFKNGRELSAWIGLVPNQHSTGGKAWLTGISKRGNGYLRTLLIHGARAALRVCENKPDRRSQWAVSVSERRGANKAVVALANRMARSAWAMLVKQEAYGASAAV
ncbi:IS110 family transposase [Magnetofaba australis]|uniref:Putative transposase IS116/IS110/IS902 family protein n=1 Tax=Magnetofaba australis IT-1 TaxID=1434232 RepID=A0A1Y2K1B9_9PROT|nr:IS110 family transposase [Magnetofaba australis]OSM01803.1 putative transposase IS116/IS110/IS902 family protein [Magnetofaba australis IT-1]OSM07159.1 putative transposase IS116/IS110/IS902 family protein [Magnetofaba australis IT-1]